MTPVLSWSSINALTDELVVFETRDGSISAYKNMNQLVDVEICIEDQCKTTYVKPKPAGVGVRATPSLTVNAVAWRVFDRRWP